jgi:hypothetical protein
MPTRCASPPVTTPATNTPPPLRKGERLRELQRQILSLDAKPATHPVAVLDDLYLNFLRKIGRHGKTDAVRTAGLRQGRRIDADQFAKNIDQCVAGIALIDGSVGLYEIFKGVDA